MSDTLATWLNQNLETYGWSIRELGRRVGISHSHAARITNGEATPSAEICLAIAQAFKVSPEMILRLAGLLPQKTEETESRREMLYLFDQLSEDTQETVITMLRGYVRETAAPYTVKTTLQKT